MREALTDIQVEQEIAELEASPLVKLARKNNRVKYMRRQRLYNLRSLYRQGLRLQEHGITIEELDHQAMMMRTVYDSLEDPDEEF